MGRAFTPIAAQQQLARARVLGEDWYFGSWIQVVIVQHADHLTCFASDFSIKLRESMQQGNGQCWPEPVGWSTSLGAKRPQERLIKMGAAPKPILSCVPKASRIVSDSCIREMGDCGCSMNATASLARPCLTFAFESQVCLKPP